MATDQFLTSVMETLEDVRGQLESRNEAPNTAPQIVGPDDTASAPQTRILSAIDQFELRQKLATKSDAELYAILSEQGRRKDTGIPFEAWVSAGGAPAISAVEGSPVLTKALDSGSGAALIRQDLEPVMLELYVRQFPLWDRIPKEPANGLVHAFNQITSFGDAQFMAELGTVTDDRSTYIRKTTNISVLATRRGVSLKGAYAVRHGGMSWSPEQLEMAGGLKAVAHKMQKTIFQGNATEPTGTATDEEGAYDPNGFDGLRRTLDTVRARNVDPATAPTAAGNFRQAIDLSLTEAMNNGGTITDIWLRPQELQAFNYQQDANVRYMGDLARAAVGVNVQQVNTIFGSLGLNVVPGDSIGQYVVDAGSAGNGVSTGNTVADVYFFDRDTVSVPYLGSEGPTVLDIPIGVSGQLVHLFIIFGMWGFAAKAPIFANKLRVKQP
jgi:hypothetical protein